MLVNCIERSMISTERLIFMSVLFWIGGATALYGILELTVGQIKVEPDIALGYRVEALRGMAGDEQWTTDHATTRSKKCALRHRLRSARGCWSIRNLPARDAERG